MTCPTDAEMKAALQAQMAAHLARNGPHRWDTTAEERMAAAADGRRLRDLPTDRAVRSPGARDRRDEAGFVSRDGGFSWSYEPEAS